MKLTVRLFAMLRERAGRDSVEIELPAGATVADAILALREQPGLDQLDRLPVRLAVNREYADPGQRVAPGDELAAIPPVSGGAPEAAAGTAVQARVGPEPLSVDALSAAVRPPCGGRGRRLPGHDP